jgi:hypothetical protein
MPNLVLWMRKYTLKRKIVKPEGKMKELSATPTAAAQGPDLESQQTPNPAEKVENESTSGVTRQQAESYSHLDAPPQAELSSLTQAQAEDRLNLGITDPQAETMPKPLTTNQA